MQDRQYRGYALFAVLHTKPTKLHLMQDAIQCANPKFEIKIHNSSAL